MLGEPWEVRVEDSIQKVSGTDSADKEKKIRRASYVSLAGSETVKLEPLPGVDSTSMVPPWD